jgi:ABC-type transport system involved in cytochrome c biogenesis permease subunit
VLGLVVHTFGLIYRMVLEGRPPVTNLYSSAIFIGWGAGVLGLILEGFWKNSIGIVISSVCGFLTLIIAHHLALAGDTMEMMRAVLDTNFWLATHVVVVTLGYASTFVAGFLAIIFIIRGFFTSGLTASDAKSLTKMVYGIACFATLFSFVGTVLGGIWADQSWGRFWGWDAKENGALMIVIWNAVILHARWGGLVRERGLMALATFGNIVTAWSWFGVNMLGIGLHSYGFMDQAFNWLILFVGLCLLLISLAMLPNSIWKSFATNSETKGLRQAAGIVCGLLAIVHVTTVLKDSSASFYFFIVELVIFLGVILTLSLLWLIRRLDAPKRDEQVA